MNDLFAALQALPSVPTTTPTTPPTPTQLDLLASEDARDAALERVATGASPAWVQAAHAAIRRVMTERTTFTSDDVWATGLEKPREPRALGAVMRAFARAGAIEATGDFVKTTQVLRHRAPLQVWRVRTLGPKR